VLSNFEARTRVMSYDDAVKKVARWRCSVARNTCDIVRVLTFGDFLDRALAAVRTSLAPET